MAAASKKLVVELYYDVISPYSYLAFETLCRYKKPWDMNLVLKPFFLGGVMKAAGNKPPAMVPNRGMYMLKDLERLSRYHEVKVQMPEQFMEWIMTKNTVNSQRFLVALQLTAPDYLEPASRAFYKRLFDEGKEIMSPECIPQVAADAKIPKEIIEKCLQQIKLDAVKNKLKENTDEAIELNAFGAPTIVAHINGKKELFFGADRMALLAHESGKPWHGPVPTQSKL